MDKTERGLQINYQSFFGWGGGSGGENHRSGGRAAEGACDRTFLLWNFSSNHSFEYAKHELYAAHLQKMMFLFRVSNLFVTVDRGQNILDILTLIHKTINSQHFRIDDTCKNEKNREVFGQEIAGENEFSKKKKKKREKKKCW